MRQPELDLEQQAPARAKTVALVVAIAFFMQMLDGTIIVTSLPQMAASFGVRPIDMSIGVTAYMLTMAAFIPVSGWFGDKFGARRIFLLSIVVFTFASLLCGLSEGLWQFVGARALQGMGGALMTPVGRIIVLKNAKKSELIDAIALITWPALTAPVVGPVLGGLITTYATWHWNFFINIPIGLLGIALVLRFVPVQTENDPGKLDIFGAVLTAAGLAALLASLDTLVHGDVTIGKVAILLIGIVLLGISILHFRKAEKPLLNLASFRVRTFAETTASTGLACRAAINATPFLLPLLLQLGYGLSAVSAGTYVLIYFLGNLGMKSASTFMLRRFGFRNILGYNGLIAGLTIMATGFISPDAPKPLVYALLLLAGLSRSMEFTAINSLGFADIGPKERSSASTLSSMLQQISMLFGVAIAAAVLSMSAQYRGALHPELVDFQLAFCVAGGVVMLSGLRFLRLPRDAGAEVSGHRPA